jgi:valyl-tRNA synthetase
VIGLLEKLVHEKVQEKWLKAWEEKHVHEFDYSDAKKPIFTIDTPPPFPTGEFHTGSTLNWCYIDFAARFKRMQGFNVFFPQGWDCHGFPTEVKVEAKYGRLPKKEFREKCLEWTGANIASIRPQMKLMGFSIDWRAEYFTISDEYKKTVQYSLLKMFDKKLIYRASHPVLWCTKCASAIAKAEIEELERDSTIYFVDFKTAEGKAFPIATTRPELLHACVAVLVNPSDARFKEFVGKTLVTPLFGKSVKILADVDADPEFGTGAVMVCTFGDKTDVVWAYRHKLPVVRALSERGELLNAGEFDGLSAAKAREQITTRLKEKGLLKKQEALKQTVKIHDRCKHAVEFIESTQWFAKLSGFKQDVEKASGEMRWIPEHSRQLLLDWINALEWDWCFSRQRAFGIPVPFWYCEKCGEVFAPKESALPVDPSVGEPPKAKCSCGGKLIGEESVCDGWVDSSVTPLIISGWPHDEKKFKRFFPSSLRPQGTDIIRTWAFYTIYRCLVLTGKPAFENVLVNGMVLGPDNKKMSKSLGNYVEAKDVIKRASVDALRQWTALSGHTGKDVVFNWKDIDYAQSFLNKLWNASKFVEKSLEGFDEKGKFEESVADKWILGELSETVRIATKAMDAYDYYTAITAIHSFFWHSFCDYYLEDIKHRIYGDDADSKRAAQRALREVLETSLKLLAPFAPYTAEEIFSELFAKRGESLHAQQWPKAERERDASVTRAADLMHSVLSEVRKFKASKALALNAPVARIEVGAGIEDARALADVIDEIKAVAKASVVEVKRSENEFKVNVIV